MSTTAPPNALVRIGAARNLRFAEPSPANMFFVGTSERGFLDQGRGLGDFVAAIGGRSNYSGLYDEGLSALAEGGATEGAPWTYARVVGPDAAKATATFNDSATPTPGASIKITAKEPGAALNGAAGGLKARITTPSAGKRRITILENGVVAATSPACSTLAELEEWSDDADTNGLVDVEVLGANLPANTGSDTNLAGGDDDRGNIDATSWQDALDRLQSRFGPGLMFADTTDETIKPLVRTHCEANKRVPFFKMPRGAATADMLDAQDEMRADTPADAHIGGTFGGYGFTRPIATEGKRLASGAALQLGNQSRVLRTAGLKQTAFGPDNAPIYTLLQLDDEYSVDERAELYAGGINVITDDGRFATWGYCTGSLEPLDQDLHHQIVRMVLRWEFQSVFDAAIGQTINQALKNTTHASLHSICERHREDGVFNWEDFGDTGYRIDLDSLNTPQTAAARQFYGSVAIRHAGTTDWAELLFQVNTAQTAII